MYTTAGEIEELEAMRKNIRASVTGFELCWSCQRVSDCDIAMVDDAAPVWLCRDCRDKLLSQEHLGSRLWPSPWEAARDAN
jgi:hypothetical protein